MADNVVAALTGADPEPFRFRGLGFLVPLGRQSAAAEPRDALLRPARLAAVARHLPVEAARAAEAAPGPARLDDRAAVPERHRPHHLRAAPGPRSCRMRGQRLDRQGGGHRSAARGGRRRPGRDRRRLAFGAAMAQLGVLPTVATLVGLGSSRAGFAVHMAISAVVGAGFGLMVRRQRCGPARRCSSAPPTGPVVVHRAADPAAPGPRPGPGLGRGRRPAGVPQPGRPPAVRGGDGPGLRAPARPGERPAGPGSPSGPGPWRAGWPPGPWPPWPRRGPGAPGPGGGRRGGPGAPPGAPVAPVRPGDRGRAGPRAGLRVRGLGGGGADRAAHAGRRGAALVAGRGRVSFPGLPGWLLLGALAAVARTVLDRWPRCCPPSTCAPTAAPPRAAACWPRPCAGRWPGCSAAPSSAS